EWMMVSAFLFWEFIRDVRIHYSKFPHRADEELASIGLGILGIVASSILLARGIEGFYYKTVELGSVFFVLQWVTFGFAVVFSLLAKSFVVWRTQTDAIQSEQELTSESS